MRFILLALLSIAGFARWSVTAGEWSRLADLPDREGVAGAFAGVSGGAIIVAGGANFPEKKPWEGGEKVWHDDIYVLTSPGGKWVRAGQLSRPLAYGVGATHGDSLICIGGSDTNRHYADAFRITWSEGKLKFIPLPALPSPIANGCGALVGNRLIVACGQESPGATTASHRAWQIDLAAKEPKWSELPRFPGRPRILPAAGSFMRRFWMLGGAELVVGKDGKPERKYLRDAWSFDDEFGWRRINDLPQPSVAAPSPIPTSDRGLFLLGGDDGSQIAASPEKHRGFPAKIFHYDPRADRWSESAEMPAPRVTVPCVRWHDAWTIPSGEIRPGVRSLEVWRWKPGVKE